MQRWRGIVGSLWLVWAGCGGATCPVGTLPTSAVLWQAASGKTELRSLRAEASVDQRGPDGRIKGKVMMFMERPDRVRFDAMTQFGPIAILTSDGDTFALTELKEKRFTDGPSCPANIGRMLGVEMTAGQVLGLLFAELPEGDAGEPEAATRCEEGHLVVQRTHGQSDRLIARFVQGEQGPARLSAVEQRDGQDRVLWDVQYEDYREVAAGLSLPRVVRLHDHRNETTLLIRFKEVAVNVEVPEDAFEQQPRPGLARERVGCP